MPARQHEQFSPSPTHSLIPVTPEKRYDLLVMNHEVGVTAIISAVGTSLDDAIQRYERANPACLVIPVLIHAEKSKQ